MNLSSLEKLNNPVAEKQNSQPINKDALRKAAEQFEALFLMQLTSALNGSTEENSEDNLFGNDGGSGLAKKMFSEQLATVMAEAGGVGLADMIMRKFQGDAPQLAGNKINPLQKTISAVNEIKNSAVRETSPNDSAPANRISVSSNSSPQVFVPNAEDLLNKREELSPINLLRPAEMKQLLTFHFSFPPTDEFLLLSAVVFIRLIKKSSFMVELMLLFRREHGLIRRRTAWSNLPEEKAGMGIWSLFAIQTAEKRATPIWIKSLFRLEIRSSADKKLPNQVRRVNLPDHTFILRSVKTGKLLIRSKFCLMF